jgi:hypothetical protein
MRLEAVLRSVRRPLGALTAALIASVVPACRALRVDAIMIALRTE